MARGAALPAIQGLGRGGCGWGLERTNASLTPRMRFALLQEIQLARSPRVPRLSPKAARSLQRSASTESPPSRARSVAGAAGAALAKIGSRRRRSSTTLEAHDTL